MPFLDDDKAGLRGRAFPSATPRRRPWRLRLPFRSLPASLPPLAPEAAPVKAPALRGLVVEGIARHAAFCGCPHEDAAQSLHSSGNHPKPENPKSFPPSMAPGAAPVHPCTRCTWPSMAIVDETPLLQEIPSRFAGVRPDPPHARSRGRSSEGPRAQGPCLRVQRGECCLAALTVGRGSHTIVSGALHFETAQAKPARDGRRAVARRMDIASCGRTEA